MTMVLCTCLGCGIQYELPIKRINRGGGKYHSPECYRKSTEFGGTFKDPNKEKERCEKISTYWSGRSKPKSQNEKNRKWHKGKVAWNKGLKGYYLASEETRIKQSESQVKRYQEHPELREAVRVRSTGRKPSAETLQKISGPNCYMYKNGQSFGRYCFRFNNRRKNATRDFFKIEDHRVCICCGITEDENIVKGKWEQFSVHHLDHDRDQGCNGKPFNLISLCHICHSRERHHEEEYKAYLNKVLREGFKWGIWSEQEYIEQVMYAE